MIFYESRVNFLKELLMKWNAEFVFPRFIRYDVRKKIQQVGLKYGLFSQKFNIKREVVVVVENLS